MALNDEARALASQQNNVVTQAQLLEAGVTRETIRWNGARSWRFVLPNVILLHNGLPDEQQRLMAAQLFTGDDAVIAGPTAAALHGLRCCSSGTPIHVLVPRSRRSRDHAWVRIRRTAIDDPGVTSKDALRLSSRPRAIVDAALATRDSRQTRAIILEAVQRRLVRIDDLEHWADRMNRRFTAVLRAALAEAAAACWSVPEADLLAALSSSTVLPKIWANPTLVTSSGARLTTT